MLVHWCMCMAAYPFFGTVADATGRLLRLQGTAAAAQIQRRLRERLGERETVARAARRVPAGVHRLGRVAGDRQEGTLSRCREARRGRRADHRLGS